jgi:hypothetical protein
MAVCSFGRDVWWWQGRPFHVSFFILNGYACQQWGSSDVGPPGLELKGFRVLVS